MGEKTALPYPQGPMLTYDVAVMLEAIAADLRQRTLAASEENGPVSITLPAMAKLEIGFKQKIRPDKTKQKLAIEITWKEHRSPAETETAGQEPPSAPDAAPDGPTAA